ncbi:phosphatase PAP2 family protein [Breznakiella homolactica]|uniref:Phosphatase PAP2 family protein n=1 Tax=Breznakiella homolactica TaxID=2798577 RepID=A0A7T8BD10_9SPIR|nr:phosphatase PAP2 family protein [Breznakiella homolactica]QQO10788.1 phosphatase PAP2 family protein [Breznakiella homolactica]
MRHLRRNHRLQLIRRIGLFTPLTWALAFIVSVLGTAALTAAARKTNRKKMAEYRQIALTGIVFIAGTFFTVQITKLFWGRGRFYDLDPVASEFTRWFTPRGITGNYSFPSAHSSGAAAMLFLTLLSRHPKYKGKEFIFFCISVIYTGIVAFSRIVNGAHFASDVLFGFLIALAWLELSKKIMKIKSQDLLIS